MFWLDPLPSDQAIEIAFAVLAAILVVPIVLAVRLDLRGKGERVPRQWPRILSWVLGVGLIAVGVYFWWAVSRDDYLAWPSAWAFCMPLTAIGVLAVVRPRWAAWELAILALIAATFGPPGLFYSSGAFLAAVLLFAATPGGARIKFRKSGGGGAPIVRPLPRA